MSDKDQFKAFSKIVAKAWNDSAFEKELLSNPGKALEAAGVKLAGKVVVHKNTAAETHFVLPLKPKGELTDEQLTMSGGAGTGNCY